MEEMTSGHVSNSHHIGIVSGSTQEGSQQIHVDVKSEPGRRTRTLKRSGNYWIEPRHMIHLNEYLPASRG